MRFKATHGITTRLQRLIDAFEGCPAIVKTATWDIVAWNRAATVVLTDYGQLAACDRNILRIMFGNPRIKTMQPDWDSVARFVVGTFRADAARAGAGAEIARRSKSYARQALSLRRYGATMMCAVMVRA